MLTLYGNLESGNVYKVRLLLAQLGLAHRRVEVNQVKGQPRSPAFLAINPIGKVPALRLEDGRVLSESGAILYYLAQGSGYWPGDPWQQANVLRWMFFEQYSHEPCLAVNRYILHYMSEEERAATRSRFEQNLVRGRYALDAMEIHLRGSPWFGAGHYGIADIALYAYTHVAHEGGFDLGPFPAIRSWLSRVAAEPRHVVMLVESADGAPMTLDDPL